MSHFRSLLFYFFFLTGTILFFSFFSPVKFFSYKVKVKLSRFWSKSVIYLAKYILNINYRVYGLKNLPKDGNYLIVSNHQSAWETVFFSYYFSCPVFILKEELKKIPIFSWYFENPLPFPLWSVAGRVRSGGVVMGGACFCFFYRNNLTF